MNTRTRRVTWLTLWFASAITASSAAVQELRKLLPLDGESFETFGASVSIDAGRTLVGSSQDGVNGSNSGSAYLFDEVTGEQLFKLTPLDGAAGDFFGIDVALDGDLALVGAFGDEHVGVASGSAYVFDATTGLQLLKLVPADGAVNDYFGRDVALDGQLALVGSSRDDDNGSNSGAAYLFDSTTGEQLLKLEPNDGATEALFGSSVALDAGLALVGASFDGGAGSGIGAAYLFDLATGQQLHKLTAPVPGFFDLFGLSVSLDAGLALIGCSGDDDAGFDAGCAFLFDASSGQELFKLIAFDGSDGDQFGAGVSLDRGQALVGAGWDDANGRYSGSAYVFDASTGQQIAKLTPSDAGAEDYFGQSVSLEAGLAVVGAIGDDDLGSYSGSAYMFAVGPGSPFGGGGAAAPCPCGNVNDASAGLLLGGCHNGEQSSGASLAAYGVASVGADSVVLTARKVTRNAWGLFFQGEDQLLPGDPLGNQPNGLLQVGGQIVRFGAVRSDVSGFVDSTRYRDALGRTISEWGGVVPGDTRHYQFLFRTTSAAAPCTAGHPGATNSTNGYTIHWGP